MNFTRLVLGKVIKLRDISLFSQLQLKYFLSRKNEKIIFNLLRRYVDTNGHLPTEEVFLAFIGSLFNEDVAMPLQGFVKGLPNKVEEDNKVLLKNLQTDLTFKEVGNNLEELVVSHQNKDIDKIKEILVSIQNKISFDDVEVHSAKDLVFERESIKMIPLFLPTASTVDLNLHKVSLVSGASGGGKSIFAMNQALFSYQQGLDVVYLNLELSRIELMARILSEAYQIPFQEIYNDNLTDKEVASINKMWKEYFNKPNKFDIVNASLDRGGIFGILNTQLLTGIDLIILDYIQIVSFNETTARHIFIESLIKELHQFCLKNSAVVLIPIQINVEEVKEKDNWISLTTRGSRELEFTASVWLHIQRSQEELEENIARLFVIKARNSKRSILVLETDFTKMSFKDTGVIL